MDVVTEEDVEWYRQHAEKGDMRAQCKLAFCYEMGHFLEKDMKLAFDWYLASAKNGDSEAQSKVGDFYRLGDHVEQDVREAYSWYRTSSLQGNIHGHVGLGICYQNEWAVEDWTEGERYEPMEIAFELYSKAARQGNAKAMYLLGWAWENGWAYVDCKEEGGRPCTRKERKKDEKKAVSYYGKSAELGDDEGQCKLGLCYSTGWHVTRGKKLAFKWFSMSAEQGNAEGQYMVGWCYEHGHGVAACAAMALPWYRRSRAQGHQQASVAFFNCLDKLPTEIRLKEMKRDYDQMESEREDLLATIRRLGDELKKRGVPMTQSLYGSSVSWKKMPQTQHPHPHLHGLSTVPLVPSPPASPTRRNASPFNGTRHFGDTIVRLVVH